MGMQSLVVGENAIVVLEKRKEGPALHLIVRLPPGATGNDTRQFVQIWRADYFSVKPHDHMFHLHGETSHDLAAQHAEKPIEWAMSQLRDVQSILFEAGYVELGHLVDQDMMNDMLPTIEAQLRECL